MNTQVRKLVWTQRIAAIAIIAFWISFGFSRSSLPEPIVDFEMNFILPDLLWIVCALFLSSRWLAIGDPRGPIASAAAGGALVFLGLLDMIFNLRHGQYTASAVTGVLNVLINAGCIAVGIWSIAGKLRSQHLP
jgi:hypothetical protein